MIAVIKESLRGLLFCIGDTANKSAGFRSFVNYEANGNDLQKYDSRTQQYTELGSLFDTRPSMGGSQLYYNRVFVPKTGFPILLAYQMGVSKV